MVPHCTSSKFCNKIRVNKERIPQSRNCPGEESPITSTAEDHDDHGSDTYKSRPHEESSIVKINFEQGRNSSDESPKFRMTTLPLLSNVDG